MSFRGDSVEVQVSVNGEKLSAKRSLELQPVTVGEKVDVFVYRMLVTEGKRVHLLENQSLHEIL